MRPAFILICVLLAATPLHAEDPYFLEVLFDGVPVEDGGWVLTVTLEAKRDLEHAEIRLSASEGLRINAGNSRWSGPLEAGEEEVMELALTLTGPRPQSIRVDLKGRVVEGASFEKSVQKLISADLPAD